MTSIFKKLSFTVTALAIGVLSIGGVASAHVTVKPNEVPAGGFQTFTIGVPNEKDLPTTSVKLLIPSTLKYVQPTQKAGWTIDIERQGEGEDATVTAITWSGNAVNAGFRDEFTFSGQAPKSGELQWKAYQTYSDGTVVAWDQAGESEEEGTNKGPFSVTKIVAETETDQTAGSTDELQASAARGTFLGIVGIIIGLAAIFLATRKTKR